PSQDVTITINRIGLPVGEHTLTVYIQPFSESFGMIQQTVQREIHFTVAEIPPTPTAGPALQSMDYTPIAPRSGDKLSITAQGFAPGEAVLVEFIGTDKTITDTLPVSQQDGSFTYQLDLSDVPAGTYTLRLTGSASATTGSAQIQVSEKVADAIVMSNALN